MKQQQVHECYTDRFDAQSAHGPAHVCVVLLENILDQCHASKAGFVSMLQ